jgi:hypothetical protein
LANKPNRVFTFLGTGITGGSIKLLLLVCSALLGSGCASSPHLRDRALSEVPAPGSPSADVGRSDVLIYALSLKGTPYRIGGESPREGFDCSGFIQHVFGRNGVALPRTSREMATSLRNISSRDMQPGDLLFFNTNGQPYSHVGLYLGSDQFIHAPSGRRTRQVRISSLRLPYWMHRFSGARRPADVRNALRPAPLRLGSEWREGTDYKDDLG